MSAPKPPPTPVLFLITGAWHGGWMFDSVLKPLVTAGYPTSIIQLPSTGIRTGAPLEKRHDVEHVRREILKEIDQGRQVALICHSYAGVPSCDAVEGLGIKERAQRNQLGGVTGLIFIAAFVLGKGGSVMEMNSKYQHAKFNLDNGMLLPAKPEAMFYNDLSYDLAAQLSQRLKPHSAVTFSDPLHYEAYRFIPSSYLMCTNDQAIALGAQEEMLSEKLECFDLIERLDSGHLPFISRPKDTLRFIHKSLALIESKTTRNEHHRDSRG